MKIVPIISSGGGVLSRVLTFGGMKQHIHMLVTDRNCGAVDVAREHDIPVRILSANTGAEFSDALFDLFQDQDIDMFVSFYTKILSGRFLKHYQGRIVNFHPSLLPACPGLDGFGDTLKSGCKFIGSTLHFMDEGVDTGEPLIQAVTPYDPLQTVEENRHKIHVQNCKMLLQLIVWMEQGRIAEHGVVSASYQLSEFVPNLEDERIINFSPAYG